MKKSAQEKYPFKMDYDCEDADFSYVAHTIKTLTIVWSLTHTQFLSLGLWFSLIFPLWDTFSHLPGMPFSPF